MHPFSLLTHPIIPHQTVHYLVLVFAVLLNSAAQIPSFFQQPEMVDPSKNGWFIMGNSIYKWMTGWSSWWFFATPLKNDGLRQSVGMMKFHSQLFLESLIKFHGSSHHQMIFLASCRSIFPGKAPKHQPTATATAQHPAAFRRSSASCASSRPRSWPRWKFHRTAENFMGTNEQIIWL